MSVHGSAVPGYDRLTEHERENFTEEGFVLYRAESMENLIGDLYSEVCEFPGENKLQGDPEFHPESFEEKVDEVLDYEDEEANLSVITRDHWQPTSYGVNPDEITIFAQQAAETPMFETTENPTPVITELVIPYSEVEFDLPKDDSSVTPKPVSRYYADNEKEYHAHYQTPAEWISSIKVLDTESGNESTETVIELENVSHDPEFRRESYTPISWELSPGSLDRYPEQVQQRFDQNELGR